MNQKEYELIADCINRTHIVTNMDNDKVRRWGKYTALYLLTTDLMDTFARVYPKTFDKAKFFERCGL